MLLIILVITAFSVVFLRDLFAIVMLFGIYSLVSASFFVNADAVDVALTEAAVGAGISTVLMLGTLALTRRREKRSSHGPLLPLIVVVVTGAALIYGTLDMPYFTDPGAPVHQHVAPRYIQESGEEIGVPNIVTSVLASYRGYDTLGETVVIFTAGLGVLTLLGRFGPRPKMDMTPPSMAHHPRQSGSSCSAAAAESAVAAVSALCSQAVSSSAAAHATEPQAVTRSTLIPRLCFRPRGSLPYTGAPGSRPA